MSLLLIAPNQDMEPAREALLRIDPNLDVEIWPNVTHKERVTFAVSWNHPSMVLGNYPNLKAVSSFGAGVNHILEDKGLPQGTRVCRIVTDALQQHMADYILAAILHYRFNLARYIKQSTRAEWRQHQAIQSSSLSVGILGLGSLGRATAEHLARLGYSVRGWSRSRKDIQHVHCFSGKAQLDEFLNAINVLVCLLPLTSETEGILNLNVFKKLSHPAYLINVGRGRHLVDEDLIYALDAGILAGACLDAFEPEPLPENHPFWNREKILLTPHVAGLVHPEKSAPVIVENYKRALSGQELLYEVSRERGY